MNFFSNIRDKISRFWSFIKWLFAVLVITALVLGIAYNVIGDETFFDIAYTIFAIVTSCAILLFESWLCLKTNLQVDRKNKLRLMISSVCNLVVAFLLTWIGAEGWKLVIGTITMFLVIEAIAILLGWWIDRVPIEPRSFDE